MTCDEVRELLPEHLLSSLDEVTDADVRRHLRGCAACRDERMKLEEGVAALSRAVHDQDPPDELRERVLSALGEEWKDAERAPVAPPAPARSRSRTVWTAVAAAIAVVLVAGSLTWGSAQAHKAQLASANAGSYQDLLSFLGGKEFRVGTINPSPGSTVHGQVLLYDGDAHHGWSSWGLVLVKAPGFDGQATATLLGPNGDIYTWPPIRFHDGQGAAWIVTPEDMTAYDRLTITSSDGSVVASASIHPA